MESIHRARFKTKTNTHGIFFHTKSSDSFQIMFFLQQLKTIPYNFNSNNLFKWNYLSLITRSYKQGQFDPDKPKIREYFYYIDHNGMVIFNNTLILILIYHFNLTVISR